MKRMVNENLIAILKQMDSEGISIGDLADTLSHLSVDEDDNLVIEDGKLENDLDVNTNQLNDVSQINFSDNSIMDTAPHLYCYLFYLVDGSESSFYLKYTSSVLVDNKNDLFNLLNNKVNDGFVMDTSDGSTKISVGFDGDIDSFDILTDKDNELGTVGGTFDMTNFDFDNVSIITLF